MSRFSGKFDFYDYLKMHDWEYIRRSDIYIGYYFVEGENGHYEIVPKKRIHIMTEEDLIPYYAHIITMSCDSDDKATVYLSEKSWPDIERERFEEWGCEYRMYDFYKEELKREAERYLVVKPMGDNS